MESASRDFECLVGRGDSLVRERWGTPIEVAVSIWVEEQPWATLLCSPTGRRHLALGFSYFTDLFRDLREVLLLEECLDDPNQIKIRLRDSTRPLPPRTVVTSGCGQGIVYGDAKLLERVPAATPMEPETMWRLMRALQGESEVHRSAGGTHASALSDGERLVAVAEDIGRHNTLDKLMGYSLLAGLDTKGMTLLTSGRVSSEMMYKAARMRVSRVLTRTSPTDVAVEMAVSLGITLVGYVRGSQFTVFHDETAA